MASGRLLGGNEQAKDVPDKSKWPDHTSPKALARVRLRGSEREERHPVKGKSNRD
jgi:hypothetical protein